MFASWHYLYPCQLHATPSVFLPARLWKPYNSTTENNNEPKLIRRIILILLFYFLYAIPHAMTHFALVTFFTDTISDSLRPYNLIIL